MVSFSDMAAYIAGTKALAPAKIDNVASYNDAKAAGVSGPMLELYKGASSTASALSMVNPALGALVGGAQAATGNADKPSYKTNGSSFMAWLPNLELIVLGVVIFGSAIFLGVGSSVANSVVKKAVSLGAIG
jgi:hypothetical protein